LNGRRPETFGALWNYDLGPRIPALEPTEYSWPRQLREAGYGTGYVGKWHVNPDHDPTRYGFEHYVNLEKYEAFRAKEYPDARYAGGWFGERDPLPLKDSRTHWLAREAVRLMREFSETGSPWHLRLDFSEPHLPCQPASPFSEMYGPEEVLPWGSFHDSFERKPYIQRQQLLNWRIEDWDWNDWAPVVSRYYGVISQVDDAIGRVLEELDDLSITEETLVIYTADHGDMCGGHRMVDKHYVLYDDVVRVPLVLRWPGRVAEGVERDELICNLLDLPPTVLEAAALQAPTFFHGRSLLPLLGGDRVSDWRKEVVSTYNGQQFGLFSQRMIRDHRWKYVWNATDTDELYDLHEDPDELRNLVAEPRCVDVLDRLRRRLHATLVKEGDSLVDNPWMEAQMTNGRKL